MNGPIGKQMVDTLVESSANFEVCISSISYQGFSIVVANDMDISYPDLALLVHIHILTTI